MSKDSKMRRAGCPGARHEGSNHHQNRRAFLREAGALAGAAAVGAVGAACAKKAKQPEPAPKSGSENARKDMQRAPDLRRASPTPRPDAPKRPTGHGDPAPAQVAGKGQVFMAEHRQFRDKDGEPARAAVAQLVDHVLQELTGKSKPLDAWATLFRPTDVVAVKPNTLGTDWYSPSPAMISVILERLRAIGVKGENIYVWDRDHLAQTRLYKWLKGGQGFQGELKDVKVGLQKSFGFHPQKVKISTGQTENLDRVIHRATAVVSVPVWKDHGLAGVTGALKNVAFGIMARARAFHPNACTPAIGDFYNLDLVRPKIRLILADVHRLIYKGGPRGGPNYNLPMNRVYATRDPVALDRLHWDETDRILKSKGMPLLMKRGTKDDKKGTPIHVEHAAKLGLGEAQLSAIKLTKKTLG